MVVYLRAKWSVLRPHIPDMLHFCAFFVTEACCALGIGFYLWVLLTLVRSH